MTVLPFLLVAAIAGTTALLIRAARRWAAAVALVGLAGMAILAGSIGPTAAVRIAGATLAASDWIRLFALLGSVVGLFLVAIDAVTVHEPDVPGMIVLGLGTAVLALSVTDPGMAVAAATAGGLAGVLVAAPVGAEARAVFVGVRELRALAIAGALAIMATAWIGRPLGELSAAPAVFGLAYLAFAIAVAIRLGAIPFHLWAARLADAAPGVALPLLLAWGPAAFAAVALVWMDRSVAPLPLPLDTERTILAAIGALSVVLGLVAALVQDDLEHVVGYTIAADAGFIVLALAGLDPAVWAPSRTWLLVFVVGRSAFAAWAVAIHGAFGTRRLPELDGWARRTPLLALGLVAIAVAAVGWPGLVAWGARADLARIALPGPIGTLVAAAPLLGIAVYGRLLRAGLAPPSGAVRSATGERPAWPIPWPRRRMVGVAALERFLERIGHAIGGIFDQVWALPAAARLNRVPLASIGVLVLAGLAAAVAAGGLGVPEAARAVPVITLPGEPGAGPGFQPVPEPSAAAAPGASGPSRPPVAGSTTPGGAGASANPGSPAVAPSASEDTGD